MRQFLFGLFVALVALLALSLVAIRHLYADNERLQFNQHALQQSVTLYRTQAGESAARVEALSLELTEFKEYHAEAVEKIRSLGVRLRRAESYAMAATEANLQATAPLRDTIILRDTIRDTVRLFSSGDAWSSITGSVRGDSISYSLHSVDTLYQVVHRVPKKFLFFRCGTKGFRQEIWSSNPHTELVYAEYVELSRRRKR